MKLLGINGDGALGVGESFIGFAEASLTTEEALATTLMDKLHMGYKMNYKTSNERPVL